MNDNKARTVMEQATRVLLGRIHRTGWPEHDGDPDPSDINGGRCVEWAELVCGSMPGAVLTEWDDPQSGLLHTFVYWHTKYYDAEQPDGAADVTGLPIFGRYPGTRTTGFVRDTVDVLTEYRDG